MRSLPDQEFFLTTLEGSIGRIYSRTVWEHNLEIFASNSDVGEDLARYADHYGSLATLDPQARLLVSPQLRRKLGIENQPVFLRCGKNCIEMYSDVTEQASLERAEATNADVLKKLRGVGLK